MKTKRAYVYLSRDGRRWESTSNRDRKTLEAWRGYAVRDGTECSEIVKVDVPLPEEKGRRG